MRKHYLFLATAALLLAAAHGASAQGTELFFSEYNEGAHVTGTTYPGATAPSAGNEKAIEIYNPTTSAVNLGAYSIRRYSNGAPLGSSLMEEERLQRTSGQNVLNSRAAYVVANPQATLPAILTKANQLSAARQSGVGAANPTVVQVGGTVWFNGDDAMALVRYPSGTAGQPNVAAGVIVDIFGVIGQQPTAATTGDGNWRGTNPLDPPYPGQTGPPLVQSVNQSLKRRASVSAGTRTSPAATVYSSTGQYQSGYNIADQWETYGYAFPPGATMPDVGLQDYSDLGSHTSYAGPFGTYGPLATLEKFNQGISIYPNPASGTATVELKDVKVGSLTVLNNLGQTISVQPRGLAEEKLTLDVSKLRPGLYFVQCLSADGQLKIFKELVVK